MKMHHQKDRKVEKGRVEFKDVSFSYREGGEPVLSHISLTAEPGETIGILGATGKRKNVAGTADSPPL